MLSEAQANAIKANESTQQPQTSSPVDSSDAVPNSPAKNVGEPSKKKIKDMKKDEQREYDRRRAQKSREKKADEKAKLRAVIDILVGDRKRKSVVVDEPTTVNPANPNKKPCVSDKILSDSEEETALKEKLSRDLPDRYRKRECKVRFAFIDLFKVETDAIVIPHYRTFEQSKLLQRLSSNFCTTDQELRALFEEFLTDDDNKKEINSYGATVFNWNSDDRERTRTFGKHSVHVAPPVIEKEQFTVVTEAHLRASYLSCLLKSDRLYHQSIAFPLLGLGVCAKRSAAIFLQTVFAYMHAVKETNFKLIYLVIPDMYVYKEVVKMFSYVREFDLNRWTTIDYLRFEKHVFDQLKEKNHYATIPGTDMIWRALKASHCHGHAKESKRVMENIHLQMKQRTGGRETPFRILPEEDGQLLMAQEHIQNGVPEDVCLGGNPVLLDIRFDMRNFCGSNQILRNLWIVSNYHMYFQEHTGDALDLDRRSDQYKERKRLFKQHRQLHSEVVKMWNDTIENAPFSCQCTLENGHHEKMMVFMTKLSYPDIIMDRWLLGEREFVLNSEDNENFVKDIRERYNAVFLHRTSEESKQRSVPNKDALQNIINNSVLIWLNSRPAVFDRQHQALLGLIEDYELSGVVGEEMSPEHHDAKQFDFEIEAGIDSRTQKLQDARLSATLEYARASKEGKEKEEAKRHLDKCTKALNEYRYMLHYSKDLEIERSLRNRFFRRDCADIINPSYPIVNPNDIEQYWLDYDDEPLWVRDGSVCTVEEYISRKLEKFHLNSFYPSEATPYDPLNASENVLNLFDSFGSNSTHSSLYPSQPSSPSSTSGAASNKKNKKSGIPPPITETDRDPYPDILDIGDLTVSCPYCGALSFEGERTWSCCKNGAIWIEPLKQIPEEIRQLFKGNYRNFLIQTNAAFSMASIRYNRQTQAKGGIQSLKIKGMVSCHPSALHPNSDKHAYANFIILSCDNEEVATARYETIQGYHNAQLKNIFLDIQKYMNKHNRLYDSFRTMAELEQDFERDREAKKLAQQARIRFRIVPPDELSTADLKALKAHNGVYARPARMNKGYITVAYTWDIEAHAALRVGRLIYPKNPRDEPQKPLSVYSDLCDQMCYPLFFPDAIGGWGLRKYERLGPQQKKPLFMDRVKAHLNELLKEHRKPEKYYNTLNDDELKRVCETALFEKAPKSSKKEQDEDDEKSDDSLEDQQLSPSTSDDEEEDFDDDPMNFDIEQHLAYGELELLQDAPINPDEVGEEMNIDMVERGGEIVPVINRKNPKRKIPFAFDIPFASDGETSEEEGSPQKGRHETHDERYLSGMESSDGEMETRRQKKEKKRRLAEMEHDVYEHFVGAEADPMANMIAAGDDIAIAEGATVEEEEYPDEEDVCYGDENDAEPTALARHNDGVRVKNVGTREYISLSEYAKFMIQERRGVPCRFQGNAKTLGQLYLIDLALRAREMRMNAIAIKRAEFPTVSNRSAVAKVYSKMLEEKFGGKKQVGMLVTMPSTVPGTSKYQQELVMSAVTVSNRLGKPHLFITFTGNPEWPEIKRICRRKKCQWADIPDIVNRVFKRKYELFLEDVVGKAKKCTNKKSKDYGKMIRQDGMFGPVVWYNYSVEFQQRGMPHCHLLICLKNPITNAAQVDEIISAEVPDFPVKSDPLFEEKKTYYNLVKNLMVHTPCYKDREAYCNQGKKGHWKQCCKGFPKKKCNHTILSDNQYPDYRRASTNKFIIRRGNRSVEAGSEYVVAHNRELLMKYRCHMNIEVVSSIKTMKYMFKYIHKGCDRVLLEATERTARGTYAPDSMTLDRNVFVPRNLDIAKVKQRQEEADRLMAQAKVTLKRDERVALNECSYMMDMSAMTSCEAAWRISGFPMHGASHVVHRAYIHEEGRDVMFTNRGVSAANAGEMLKKKSKGMMTAWFEANQNPVDLPNNLKTTDLTLDEMMTYFMFDVKKQEFIRRKYDYSRRFFGRIQAPQPRWLELTATRLLSQTVKGPTCWEDLRHFRGTTYPTCLEAARARGLMNGDIEWDLALTEIAQTKNPIECRRFYASILVHCAPANPKELWEKHWNDLVNNTTKWTEQQKKAHALRHIEFLLKRHGMGLGDFELESSFERNQVPVFIDSNDDVDNPEGGRLSAEEHKRIGNEMLAKLNPEQKVVVDRAIEMRKSPSDRDRMMFVEGPGGTGKTFCYETIYHLNSAEGIETACVSHAGIAASLLPYGVTSHRKFSIPLEVHGQMICKVALESPEAEHLRRIGCIIWDEVCMSDRRIIYSVDTLFKQLKNNTLSFGGVQIIMGGDWRQTLPIVDGVKGFGVTNFVIKNTELWKSIEKFKLTQNKRAQEDPQYAKRILAIGDGANYIDEKRKMVFIPNKNIERRSDRALADWVFPNVNLMNNMTKNSALLTVDNKTALRLNEVILDKLDSPCREFLSLDTPDKDNGMAVDAAIFASETPSGMPPHRLRLKVGAQVVLMRNISIEQGLCNGTRLTVDKFGDDIIYCTVNNPRHNSPPKVYLHRMLLSATGKGAKNCGFKRLQYPIRLAYAMTINKSQGQTLERCGLVLHSPVFSHGQLYVAMSRVKRSADFKLWHTRRTYSPKDDDFNGIGMLVRNIVYKDILRDDRVEDLCQIHHFFHCFFFFFIIIFFIFF
ncbi:hypothetical protein CAEBREN_18254 [Caenorhabditis brenneri]|uniref:ATP-dependent DNA helicase n=1 Tax=Caenorhabditis brenneri TaxID=135651 RepID=G0PDR0_CAEBE|nr:hypothetical protein CAEBREN_18254 [Caenorhabditis brenneri]